MAAVDGSFFDERQKDIEDPLYIQSSGFLFILQIVDEQPDNEFPFGD